MGILIPEILLVNVFKSEFWKIGNYRGKEEQDKLLKVLPGLHLRKMLTVRLMPNEIPENWAVSLRTRVKGPIRARVSTNKGVYDAKTQIGRKRP